MDQTQVYAGLHAIFTEVFERDDIALGADLSAKDVAGWDSFKQIEIIIAVERRFAFKFTSAEIDSMRQLGDLAAIVARRGHAPKPQCKN